MTSSVSDLYSFDTDPDPEFFLYTDPDPEFFLYTDLDPGRNTDRKPDAWFLNQNHIPV